MGIVYRHQKKEPLTIEEMDGNFFNLDTRLKILEEKPATVEGIAKVNQEGDQLVIIGTFGGTLGKVLLPKILPCFKGKWQTKVAYRYMDWVQIKQSLFSCILAHTSQEFQADQKYWQLVFEL